MIVFYAGVSTTEQTTAHQRTQAEQAGFKIDKVVADEGASGVSTRLAERLEGQAAIRRAAGWRYPSRGWVDRLRRSYTDVVDTIREFMRRGVIIRTVINGMVFDGSTMDPMQQDVRDARIAFMAATAQAQAEATKSAQRAGIDHKRRAQPSAYPGRKPSYDRATFDRTRLVLDSAAPPSLSAVAKAEGLSRQTAFRIKQDPIRRGRVGCVGFVTAQSACASRRYASILRSAQELRRQSLYHRERPTASPQGHHLWIGGPDVAPFGDFERIGASLKGSTTAQPFIRALITPLAGGYFALN